MIRVLLLRGQSFRRRKGTDRKRLLFRGVLILIASVAVLSGLYVLGRKLETNRVGSVRGDLSARQTDRQVVEYDGKQYAFRNNLQTILFMGVDRADETLQQSSFRNGGQADFLLLMVIDQEQKSITQLQIDRDTMAEITILGILGNAAGTRNAQICLSHGFGDGGAQSCEFTMEAVSRLLYGVEMNQYIALRLDSISVLNDAVGGVIVNLEDDFTAYDPTMTAGSTLLLDGDQAEIFIRNRYAVGDGSNASRMKRQRTYMSAIMNTINERLAGNANFVGILYDALGDTMVTNMKRGKLINEAYKASGYTRGEALTLAGEHVVGEDGFVEFHADTAALEQMVIDIFYKEI